MREIIERKGNCNLHSLRIAKPDAAFENMKSSNGQEILFVLLFTFKPYEIPGDIE
jgi:hypothetical protein